MWKKKDEGEPTGMSQQPFGNASHEVGRRPGTQSSAFDTLASDVARIGKSVVIKGEVSGSEDLYIDGQVEGSVQLKGHTLTIGPNGQIRARVQARGVVIHGKVDGNVEGTDRVDLRKSAVLVGNISTQRIAIEDGAFFKGAVDLVKEVAAPPLMGKTEAKHETTAVAAASSTSPAVAARPTSIAPLSGMEQKKP
ncbi:MAG TPA: polymer-forming cytoskeletal protein [Terriglobales bacterium]|nr:polymer-forming cytoskeletal protein [Terriglobales bacterium]